MPCYLAAASLWKVAQFPAANRGAEVETIEDSIAADGPMVAAVLAALGQPSLLMANGVGDDPPGHHVRNWLQQHRVQTTTDIKAVSTTPRIVVVGDNHDTRTRPAFQLRSSGTGCSPPIATSACVATSTLMSPPAESVATMTRFSRCIVRRPSVPGVR